MTDADITLYLRPGWSSLFPHILLHEQGISFQTISVTDHMVTEDQAFAQKNPKKQIPVLMINGRPVTENPAIAHAVQSLKPDNKIMGQNINEFIRVCEWLNWISASFHGQAWSPYLRSWRFTTDPSGEAAVKAKAYEKLCERFAMIEGWLPAEGWAVGKSFTVVDAYLLPYYQWADADLDLDVQADCQKYTALMKKVAARPSVQKALGREAGIKAEMGGDEVFEGNR